MTPAALAAEAARSLAAHRLRAALAAFGVTAGVAAIVAAFAIGDGARRRAMAEIGTLGVDNVIVRSIVERDARGRALASALTLDDAAAIAQSAPGVAVAALRSAHGDVIAADRRVATLVAGVTDGWPATARLTLSHGRWFTAREPRARIAVMGAALARSLFRDADPIGQRVFAAGEWRTIVGVIATAADPRSARAVTETVDADRAIFVPFDSLDVALGQGDAGDAVERLVARAPAGVDVTRVAAAMTSRLAARHRGRATAFETVVPRELLRARLRTERTSRMTLVAFGALALVIGGAGIANIMLASVAERAAEIGLRRAVGARRTAIVVQFAAEAVALSAAGAVTGTIAGIAGASLVAAWAGWPVAVTPASPAIATTLALGVGLVAGLFPAHRAASVSPIEALRTQG